MKTRPTFGTSALVLFILVLSFGCKSKSPGEPGDDITPCPAPVGQWQLLGLENETVTAIALHPSDPRIIYVGTQADFSAGVQGKLFKSVNCGTTWDTLLIGGSYSDVELDPKNPESLYAIPGSLIKSTDGGRTWQTIMIPELEVRVSKVAIDPKNPNILYAGQGGIFGGSFYKSTNGGGTWTNLWNSTIGDAGAISIAIDPQNTNIIFVGTQWSGSVLKTIDGGASWTTTGIRQSRGLVDMVAVNPEHSNIIYAGIRFEGLLTSTNGGETWEREGLADSILNCPDLAFNPSNRLDIYAATAYGIFNKQCQSCPWQEINEGILVNRSINVLKLGKDYNIYGGRSTLWEQNGGIFVRKIIR